MTVPLLLPIRLETRFYPHGDMPRELRIRVVPDEVWFDDHDPATTDLERQRLRVWRAARDQVSEASNADPADAARRRAAEAKLHGAWRRLVDVAGVGRARWLADAGDVPAQAAPGERIRRAVGFPRRLEVWLYLDVALPEAAPRLVLTPDVDALRLDFPQAAPGKGEGARWWNSYDEARNRGLAGSIELTDKDRAAFPFDCLLVVGLGDTSADALFGGHRDTGRLAVLSPGLATNTVAGGSTPSRRADPAIAPAPPAGAAGLDHLVRLLLGSPDRLGRTPVAAQAPLHEDLQAAIVSGLWPALWGHALTNLWVTGEAVHAVGEWAATALRPEGPLPPVRIGDLPYGILPVTRLARFVGNPVWGEPEVIGSHLVPRLLRARDAWLAAAEQGGTVVGADIERLLDLAGRVPVSSDVRWRKLVPHDLALLLDAAEDRGHSAREHADWWASFTDELAVFSILPYRRLSALYGARKVGLPLLVPANSDTSAVATALRALLSALVPGGEWRPEVFVSPTDVSDLMGVNASVALRLARASLQLALADDGRTRAGDPPPTLDLLLQSMPSRLAQWIERAAPVGTSPQTATLLRGIRGLARLADLVEAAPEAVERTIRGALDSTSHRLDAWLTAPANFRLHRLLDAAGTGAAAARLGAYGWVDQLAAGGGGPTDGGALLAPSQSRAATAAVLRDRHLRAAREGDVSWAMDITSTRAREAKRLADAVRAGLHPAVALGLEVERLVDDPLRISLLRQRFPARRNDDGRRVADGMQVLATVRTEVNLWDDLDGHALTLRIRDTLGDLLDSYADLVTAEAVHRVVEGRGAIAGEVLDGAAGLGPPPTLEVLEAPALARHLTTVVVAAIPLAPRPTDPAPVDRADASVARFVDARFGPRAWRWSVTVTGPDRSRQQEITLSELGLRPADAATHAPESLEALVVREAVARTARDAGVPATGLIGVLESADGTAIREELGRCLRALGRHPFTIADLKPGATNASGDPAVVMHAERLARDLFERLVDLAAAASRLIASLRAATAETLESAVLETRQWGLSSSVGAMATPERLATILERRQQSVESALRETVQTTDEALAGDLGTWVFDALPATTRSALLRVPAAELGELIASLVAPEGDLAVLAPNTATDGPLALVVPGDPRPLIDWLATISAVRPRLAELEADFLGRELGGEEVSTTISSSHPDDPWQLSSATATGANAERLTSPPPMIVEFGQQGARIATGVPVALALVDRFSEEVPEERRPPSVAFGFDAPGARAPQAFLALVPPAPDREWSPSGAELAESVLEARSLARVRMALPTSDALSALASFLPTVALPLHGPVGVDFSGEE